MKFFEKINHAKRITSTIQDLNSNIRRGVDIGNNVLIDGNTYSIIYSNRDSTFKKNGIEYTYKKVVQLKKK